MTSTYFVTLHSKNPDCSMSLLWKWEVCASSIREAKRKVYEEHWDTRLDIPGCFPLYDVERL